MLGVALMAITKLNEGFNTKAGFKRRGTGDDMATMHMPNT